MSYRTVVLALCLAVMAQPAAACDAEASRLGHQVQAAADAVRNPGLEGAMRMLTDLGTDSRYYTMMRGWLMQQLKGDQSIVAASGSNPMPRIEARIRFLEDAIRAIDLE